MRSCMSIIKYSSQPFWDVILKKTIICFLSRKFSLSGWLPALRKIKNAWLPHISKVKCNDTQKERVMIAFTQSCWLVPNGSRKNYARDNPCNERNPAIVSLHATTTLPRSVFESKRKLPPFRVRLSTAVCCIIIASTTTTTTTTTIQSFIRTTQVPDEKNQSGRSIYN